MRQCSMDHVMNSLAPWLDNEYLMRVAVRPAGEVSFFFRDGVSETYGISDCDQQRIMALCRELAARGVAVEGL